MKNPENKELTIEYLDKNIKILKNNEIYRICDLLKFKKTHGAVKRIINNDIYKETIMRKYFDENNKPKNLNRLYVLTKNYMLNNKIKIYDNNYLLVHIRTGDDINKRGLNNSSNFNFYLDRINKHPKKIVVIVTAMHYGHSNKENKLYGGTKYLYSDNNKNINLQRLHELIKKIPNKVLICSNINTDIDLVKLTFSKNVIFCMKAGGFAKTVNTLHEKFLKEKNLKIPEELFIKIE